MFADHSYMSTPHWPSGSPGAEDVYADYEVLFGESAICGQNERKIAAAQLRNAMTNRHLRPVVLGTVESSNGKGFNTVR